MILKNRLLEGEFGFKCVATLCNTIIFACIFACVVAIVVILVPALFAQHDPAIAQLIAYDVGQCGVYRP